MKKVVINKCFGGFSLSPLAIKEIANRKGEECYFFEIDTKTNKYRELTLEEAKKSIIAFAYNVKNPQDYNLEERDDDGLYRSANERAEKIAIDYSDREDADLIYVVEKLGEQANGKCAKLKVLEIPDNVEYEIDEYDGNEHIAEIHRTWY